MNSFSFIKSGSHKIGKQF